MLEKVACEICGLRDSRILHRHHIIPQCDPRCTNSSQNLAILCPSCHSYVHAGDITIIGVYPSTEGRSLVWFKKGEEPPIAKEFWIVQNNPLVLTLAGNHDDYDQ